VKLRPLTDAQYVYTFGLTLIGVGATWPHWYVGGGVCFGFCAFCIALGQLAP
jgi:hypothetical protein